MTNVDDVTRGMSTEAGAVARVVERHLRPRIFRFEAPGNDDETSAEIMAVPKGFELVSIKRHLDEYRTRPERRKGTAKHVDLDSFIHHVDRFKDEDSALFAMPHPTAPTLTAVFDYHRENQDGVAGEARFGEHRAVYTFPVADEWKAWTERHGKPMQQGEFAEFIEDHVLDVADPTAAFTAAKAFAESLGLPSFASPAKLLDLSRGLTVHVEDRTSQKVNPSTGEVTMFFEAEHKDAAGAALVVPRAFILQIPVFREGSAYQFPVRLKYRAGGGRVTWLFEIHKLDRAFTDAFREACATAAEKTGLPLFYGSPEAP